MDLIHSFTNWFDRNRGTAIAMLVAIALVVPIISVAGCKSTTGSLMEDGSVNRSEFEREVVTIQASLEVTRIGIMRQQDAYNSRVAVENQRIDSGRADLDEGDAVRAEVLDWVGSVVPGLVAGTTAPGTLLLPAIMMSIGILGGSYGIGKRVDIGRKDNKITELKEDDDTNL